MRRSFTAAIVVAAIAAVIAPMPGQAQSDYPNRVVKIVVPYGAGSVPDILVRALAPGLSSRLGQQFIVENRAGGSGALGTASVARAEADGYTVLFAPAVVLSVLPQARNAMPATSPTRSLPVCQTFVNTMGLAVRPESPIKTIGDLVAAAKQKPGALNYGHPGVMHHSASRGGGVPAGRRRSTSRTSRSAAGRRSITELLGGRIDVLSIVMGTEVGQNIRVIGVFAREAPRLSARTCRPSRSKATTSVPASFGGLLAPRATPQPILSKLSSACADSGKGRSVCDDRQERRPARRLFRRRGGVPAASRRATSRQQGARARRVSRHNKKNPGARPGFSTTHARGSLLRPPSAGTAAARSGAGWYWTALTPAAPEHRSSWSAAARQPAD